MVCRHAEDNGASLAMDETNKEYFMMRSSTIPLKSDVAPHGNTAGLRRKRRVWRLSLLSLYLLALASWAGSAETNG